MVWNILSNMVRGWIIKVEDREQAEVQRDCNLNVYRYRCQRSVS